MENINAEEEEKNIDIKIDEPIKPIKSRSNNPINDLPTDEYFKATVQNALEQGLLNIAMLHPTDPIKFLGNYLIESSKKYSSL